MNEELLTAVARVAQAHYFLTNPGLWGTLEEATARLVESAGELKLAYERYLKG